MSFFAAPTRIKKKNTRYDNIVKSISKSIKMANKQDAEQRAALAEANKRPARLMTQMPFTTGQTASPDASSESDSGLMNN